MGKRARWRGLWCRVWLARYAQHNTNTRELQQCAAITTKGPIVSGGGELALR